MGTTTKMLAQIDYAFSAVAGTYNAITSTTDTLADISGYGANEEGFQNAIPLGFIFNYNGINYTTVGFVPQWLHTTENKGG